MLASTEQAYAYVAGSPTNFTDPTGECIPFCLVAGIAFVAGAIIGEAVYENSCVPNCNGFDRAMNILGGGAGGVFLVTEVWAEALYIASVGGPRVFTGASTPRFRVTSGYTSGSQPNSSAVRAYNDTLLQKTLANQKQMCEVGKPIAGPGSGTDLRDAPRLAATYGGQPNDWVKMTSSSYRAADGLQFQTPWYQNIVTGQRFEPKVKLHWRR